MTESITNVTQLLAQHKQGSPEAYEQLLPIVYAELHRIAARSLRGERSNHTLQPTALVHEAYLKLIDQTQIQWENRAQFFGVAANLIRRILVDHARAKKADKRGGNDIQVEFDENNIAGLDKNDVDILDLEQALQKLQTVDERKFKIIELHYYGGLSNEETAEVLGISLATVKREWTMAKAWLFRELNGA